MQLLCLVNNITKGHFNFLRSCAKNEADTPVASHCGREMALIHNETAAWPSGKAKMHVISMSDLRDYILSGNTLSIQCESGLVYMLTSAMKDMFPTGDDLREDAFSNFERAHLESPLERNESFLSSMTQLLQKKVAPADIRRGDIVGFEFVLEYGYRNAGKAIWNGAALEPLDYEYDDYGAVPTSYLTLRPYPVGYFTDLVDHNFLHTFLYSDIAEEMKKNTFRSNGGVVTFFTAGNRRYYVAVDDLLDYDRIVIDIDPNNNSEDDPGFTY